MLCRTLRFENFLRRSPLAGDINWMETGRSSSLLPSSSSSPLAGDINWMETLTQQGLYLFALDRSPLAGDINWMETLAIAWLSHTCIFFPSPLAGDINWMETGSISCCFYRNYPRPHSLGTLIEWKPRAAWLIRIVIKAGESPLAGDINWMETLSLHFRINLGKFHVPTRWGH